VGLTYADIELSNPRQPEREPVHAAALADTGAMMLLLPPRIAAALDLEVADRRRITLADGRTATVPYVGPIRVRFEGRVCFVGAFVVGDEVVLGAVPMEDMDLVVSPLTRTVRTNPSAATHRV
jgi:clan AA aspartic protease